MDNTRDANKSRKACRYCHIGLNVNWMNQQKFKTAEAILIQLKLLKRKHQFLIFLMLEKDLQNTTSAIIRKLENQPDLDKYTSWP